MDEGGDGGKAHRRWERGRLRNEIIEKFSMMILKSSRIILEVAGKRMTVKQEKTKLFKK